MKSRRTKPKAGCFACVRIQALRQGQNPQFIKEMRESYAVLSDGQGPFKGWCVLLLKDHHERLSALPSEKVERLYKDVMDTARALDKVLKPRRLNYENLGNLMHHIHWHVIPRHKGDPKPHSPVWNFPLKVLKRPLPPPERQALIRRLRRALAAGLLLALSSLAGKAQAGWFPRILSEGKPYLPDYSYAGWRWGEPIPPTGSPTLDASAFGVIPDDGKDDSAALQAALKSAAMREGPQVLNLPAGKIILRDILLISGGNLILKGQGRGKTIFEIPIPLDQVRGAEAERLRKEGENFAPTSPFSWAGGFLAARPGGDYWKGGRAQALEGRRGDFRIRMGSVGEFRPGQALRIGWYNREGAKGSLLAHAFGTLGLDFGEQHWKRPDSPVLRQHATVREQQGQDLILVEPLAHDIRPEWTVRLEGISPLEGLGMEGFTLKFPDTPYPGHHKEEGYNGIFLDQVRQSWIRDVEIINADSGIILDACQQVSVLRTLISGRAGHYSVKIGGGSGVLVKDFRFTAPALHNPSFNTYAAGSAYVHGYIENARLDQHNGGNHQNLFDDIELKGDASRLFDHGGSSSYRPAAGAFNTFWNLRVIRALGASVHSPKPLKDAPHARLVGLSGDAPLELDYGPEAYIEGLNQPGIEVPSLYEWQMTKRTASR